MKNGVVDLREKNLAGELEQIEDVIEKELARIRLDPEPKKRVFLIENLRNFRLILMSYMLKCLWVKVFLGVDPFEKGKGPVQNAESGMDKKE